MGRLMTDSVDRTQLRKGKSIFHVHVLGNSIYIYTAISNYRVTRVVEHLGWVDLDLACSITKHQAQAQAQSSR